MTAEGVPGVYGPGQSRPLPDLGDGLRARVEQLEQRTTALQDALAQVLSRFTEPGHPGRPCRRTGWQTVEQIAAWQTTLRGDL